MNGSAHVAHVWFVTTPLSFILALNYCFHTGNLSEWLRSDPAKVVRNACESSNLSVVDSFCTCFCSFWPLVRFLYGPSLLLSYFSLLMGVTRVDETLLCPLYERSDLSVVDSVFLLPPIPSYTPYLYLYVFPITCLIRHTTKPLVNTVDMSTMPTMLYSVV